MKKLLYSLGLLLGSLSALAQRQPIYQPLSSGGATEYAAMVRQPLLVVLPEATRPRILRRQYHEPGKPEAYEAEIAAKRTILETAAKRWTLGEVKFITPAESDKLQEDKEQAHLVLNFGDVTIDLGPPPGKPMSMNRTLYLAALKLRWVGKTSGGIGSQLVLSQLLQHSDQDNLLQTYHPSDFINIVQQMQTYVQQRAQGKDEEGVNQAVKASVGNQAAVLKSKTLLLDRAQLSDKLSEEKIAQAYPYPVQLTDRAAIEAAVAAADPRYLYIRFVTVLHNNGYLLLDAASGQLVGYAEYHLRSPFGLGTIKDSNLEEIAQTATSTPK